MKHVCAMMIAVLLVVCAEIPVHATIVWKGQAVEEWPTEAFPERTKAHKHLAKATSTTTGLGFYASPKGAYKGLTLLVDFSDNPATFTKAEVLDWLNKPGFTGNGCEGSVRDFYLDVSNGLFDYSNDVYGYYRAKHTKAWYESLNSGLNNVGADSLLKEVIAAFDDSLDYAQYDVDKDGYTDAINIVYVGNAVAWNKGLWPHAGIIGEQRDNVILVRYEMTNLPSAFSLGTFVHENGHMIFGWPDLYYFGDYCMIGMGASDSPKNPVPPNDFYRADQGWIPLTDLSSTLFSAETTNASNGYLYSNPNNSKEGYFWSYIKGWKRWSYLGSSGLLVLHYNLAEMANSSPTHLQLRVVEADGNNYLLSTKMPSPGYSPSDFFSSVTRDSLINPLWYDSSESGLRLTKVGNPMGTISFIMEGPGRSSSLSSSSTNSSSVSSSSGISSSSTTTRVLVNGSTPSINPEGAVRYDLLGRSRSLNFVNP